MIVKQVLVTIMAHVLIKRIVSYVYVHQVTRVYAVKHTSVNVIVYLVSTAEHVEKIRITFSAFVRHSLRENNVKKRSILV